MIKTTVYSDGIISEGYYYDHRGIKTTVEYAGDKLGYGDLMLGLCGLCGLSDTRVST